MSTRFIKTKTLFDETFEQVESSKQEYLKFLDFSSKHYKHPFQDIVLIYNQRPTATAVTDMAVWNSIYHRRVKKGTRSIAVFDQKSNTGLNYLFDTADTYGDKTPEHWQYESKHESGLKRDIYDKYYSKKLDSYFENDDIGFIIYSKVLDDCEEYLNEYLSDEQDSVFKNKFTCAVVGSVCEIIKSRSGIKCNDVIDESLIFQSIQSFDTYELRARIYVTINEIAKDTLLSIEQSVKRQNNIIERSNENGTTNLHESRASEQSEHSDNGELQTSNTIGEIRKAGSSISEREKQIQSSGVGDAGNIVRNDVQGGTRGERDDEHLGTTDVREEPTNESTGLDSNSEPQENDRTRSRGDSFKRLGISNEIENTTSDEAVEDTASFFVPENDNDTERRVLDDGSHHELFLDILKQGNISNNGKDRIFYAYNQSTSDEAFQNEIHNIYDNIWSEIRVDNKPIRWNMKQDGLDVFINGFGKPFLFYPISEVAVNIANLIQDNQYLDQEKPERSSYFAPKSPVEIAYTPELAEQNRELDIERVLLDGGIVAGGKQRIVDFFSEKHTASEKAAFLKDEYGIGGQTVYFHDGRRGFEDHSSKGIEITNFGYDSPRINLTWAKVVKGIEALIDNGKYFEKRYPNDKPPIKKDTPITLLNYIDNDIQAEELVLKEATDDKALLDYGYTWDGMLRIDDETAIQLYDKGEDVFLIYSDNSEVLADSEKRLVQHINDGGLVGIERESSHVLDNLTQPTEETNQVGIPIQLNDHEIDFNSLPIRQNLFERIKDLAPHIIDGRYDYQKMQTTGFMDLNIDRLDDTRIAIAHNYIQNGDVMADPDVTFTIDIEKGEARPFAFQNDSLGIYRQTINEDGTHLASYERELTNFTIDWLRNVKNQGHVITTANYSFDSESEPSFNINGLEYGFDIEPPKDEKLDYSFDEYFEIPNGQKTRYNLNIDAIKTLQKIESENRLATSDEQDVLAKYVGWGGIPNAFDNNKSDWSNEYTELKRLLSDLEYSNAKASTLNAHYTNPTVINAMYSALSNFGFNGGHILEPAVGTGNFFSALPKEFRENSSLTGVEIDSITARIAKQLHQSANIQESAFEHTNFKDNSFDVVIGNIPFGSYNIGDKLIHDYFVASTIDKVHDGGIVAVITSKGTLDKKDSSFREEISKKADLIGAIRLPNNAFKQNANTSVTTDILFFQKKDNALSETPSWVRLSETKDGIPINAYFAENPHMVLGRMTHDNRMYGRETDTTCEPIENADLSNQLQRALSYLTAEYIALEEIPESVEPRDILNAYDYPNIKNFSYSVINEKIYYRETSELILQDLSPTHTKRILDIIELRSAVRDIIDVQVRNEPESIYVESRQRLNSIYDEFVETHGRINSRGVSNVCRHDADYPLLASLEVIDDDKQIKKADIFYKPTIKPHIEIDKAGTSIEALGISKNLKGRIDIEYIAELTNQDKDTVVSDLEGIIFRNPLTYDAENPYDGFETSESYLSGDVREKLHLAKAYLKEDDGFSHNVKALEAVQPKDLSAEHIDVRLGTTWIPLKYYEQFICDLFELPQGSVEVDYSDELDRYLVHYQGHLKYRFNPNEKFGTGRMNGFDVFLQSLNLQKPKIYDYDENRKAHLNSKETFAVRDKQEMMISEFQDWIYKAATRRNDLVKIYNEKFNNIRVPSYDGSYLSFPSMNPDIELRPHQKNAVARSIYESNVLFAHEVGAGKSFVMCASAMELKRLGLVNKPMITVPNHLVDQMGGEFMRLYPSANILLATKRDFQKENRQRLVSKIVTGNYDAIIIAHSTFGRIGVSPKRMEQLIRKQIDDYETAISNTEYQGTVKMLETQKKRLKGQLEKLLDAPRDNQVFFEDLGVDCLIVDEAHEYKNLMVATKMSGVAGVPSSASKKASDMYSKIGIIQENSGRVIFATGTPITNSLGEMYTLQRYLQPELLHRMGLGSFDKWVSTFGEVQTSLEIGIDNSSVRTKERLAVFKNLPEMMNMYRMVADIQTQEMLNLPRPALKTGKPIVVVAKASPELIEKNGEFTERVENIKQGSVDPKDDNALKITNEGRAMAMDIRLDDPMLPDYEYSKINLMVNNIFNIWEETSIDKLTQMVFSDLGTPTGVSFNVYQDVKDKLIAKGIPENEVAFIHDANTDKQKDALFREVRNGNVRVLMGSTRKMGTGTNCQKKLIAMHETDCPWRPADVAQREGRILRQGNENPEVSIYRYVTEGSFDGYNWNLIESKYNFFKQIQNGDEITNRTAENIDEVGLSYAEIKAIASGNPLLKDKALIDVEVSRLATLKQQYDRNIYRLQDNIAVHIPNRIAELEEKIELLQKDILSRQNNEEFSIELKGREFTDKTHAATILHGYISSLPYNGKRVSMGKYRGFDIYGEKEHIFNKIELIIKGHCEHRVTLGNSSSGNLTRIDNEINSFDEKVNRSYGLIEEYKDELESAKLEVDKPFQHADKLKEQLQKKREINHKLGFGEEQDDIQQDEIAEEQTNEIER